MDARHVCRAAGALVSGLLFSSAAAAPAHAQQWSQADSATILLGKEAGGTDAFNSGRAVDVLPLQSGDCLVASESGGVWLAYSNGAAVALSNEWKRPDMACLASVFRNEKHVLAGGTGLYVTDYTQPNPLFHWIDVTPPVSLRIGTIYRIASFSHDTSAGTRQCLALAASGGFFYCDLPPAPAGPYNWKTATGLPDPQVPCSGLAAGPLGSGRICVSLATVGMNVYLGLRAIYYGDFDTSGNLVFRPANANFLGPVDEQALRWTSLDSCDGTPKRMYAVYFDKADGKCAAVLRSDDAGMWWNECSRTFDDGNPNNNQVTVENWLGEAENGGLVKNVAVHPLDPDRVHLAGLRPLASIDGGKHWVSTGGTWTAPSVWTAGTVAFHLDWHVARFDRNSFFHVFAATDGGLLDAWSSIPPTNFYSGYNAHLYSMQHYSHPLRGFRGYSDFSQLVPGFEGLCSCGLQDNANVTDLMPDGVPPPWSSIMGGDGGWNTFLEAPGSVVPRLIASNIGSDKGNPAHELEYVGGSFNDKGVVPILSDQNGASDSNGLSDPILVKVDNLGYIDSTGNYLFAVAAGGRWDTVKLAYVPAYNQVFGLFADPSAGNPIWEYLGDVGNGELTAALASWDGQEIVIGTSAGNIRHMQTSTGTTTAATLAAFPGGVVFRFALTGPATGFANYSNLNVNRGAVIERVSGGSSAWQTCQNTGLPQVALYDIAFDAAGGRFSALYVCSDRRVFRSKDGAANWIDYSTGLPETPHGATLHPVLYPSGERFLYLSTWGRSMWRTRLPRG